MRKKKTGVPPALEIRGLLIGEPAEGSRMRYDPPDDEPSSSMQKPAQADWGSGFPPTFERLT
jgi:hypothetical protein